MRRRRTTSILCAALVLALVFGVTLLIDGDWIPGTIIVVAALIGLGTTIPALLRSGAVN